MALSARKQKAAAQLRCVEGIWACPPPRSVPARGLRPLPTAPPHLGPAAAEGVPPRAEASAAEATAHLHAGRWLPAAAPAAAIPAVAAQAPVSDPLMAALPAAASLEDARTMRWEISSCTNDA